MLNNHALDVYSWEELLLRLGLAAFLGLLLGLDRELRGHDAGMRTHALVALSSAMIMVSSLMLFVELRTDDAQPDPLRSIQGLSQAIGIACGSGQYGVVLIGAAIALLLLVAVRLIERFLPSQKPNG
jgi:putative Mg2+ transporter-C (MgtC) family protein